MGKKIEARIKNLNEQPRPLSRAITSDPLGPGRASVLPDSSWRPLGQLGLGTWICRAALPPGKRSWASQALQLGWPTLQACKGLTGLHWRVLGRLGQQVIYREREFRGWSMGGPGVTNSPLFAQDSLIIAVKVHVLVGNSGPRQTRMVGHPGDTYLGRNNRGRRE